MTRLNSASVLALIDSIWAFAEPRGLDVELLPEEVKVLVRSQDALTALHSLRAALIDLETATDHCCHGTDLQVEPCEDCWLDEEAQRLAEEAVLTPPGCKPTCPCCDPFSQAEKLCEACYDWLLAHQ